MGHDTLTIELRQLNENTVKRAKREQRMIAAEIIDKMLWFGFPEINKNKNML